MLAAALSLAAVFGFVFGRTSGLSIVSEKDNGNYPAPPAPPKPSAAQKLAPGRAPGQQPKPDKNIILEVPTDGAVLGDRFGVSGRALVPGDTVAIEVRDADGAILLRTTAAVLGEAGQFGRFDAEASLPSNKMGDGTVEVFWNDPSDGSIRDPAVRHVTFAPGDVVPVKVYFSNSSLDTEFGCDQEFPVARFVSRQDSIYRGALQELLRGPTEDEKVQGYFTSLPANVRLKSVVNDADGTASADFGAERGKVAGSCRVSAITAQITRTLEQFPEVRRVTISIEGKSEGILQP